MAGAVGAVAAGAGAVPPRRCRIGHSILLVVVLALSAACGGGKPSPAADRAAAQKANLEAADFPSGWNSRPHEKLPGEDELRPDIARCLGVPAPPAGVTAEARSPDFTQGLATVSSVVTFLESEERAGADAQAYTGDKFGACAQPGYVKQMHEVAPEGNQVQEVNTSKLDFPRHGDASAAYRIAAMVHIPALSGPLPINIDLVHIFEGRAHIELTVVAPGPTFPPDFATRLARGMVGRL